MTITPAGVGFNWSICGRESSEDISLLKNESNICYSGRRGKNDDGDGLSCYLVGGHQDQISMSSIDNYGVLKNSPLKELYFGTELNNIGDAPSFDLRIEYDIVTLTTAEQADLYQRGLCS
jgi:hypothetical protein